MNKRAFTLLELLVVIGIIGTVVTLFMPALGKAREGARRAQCASNLRQIGMAVHMYIDDHDFRLPPYQIGPNPDEKQAGDYWYGLIEPYTPDTDVFRCPSYKYHVRGHPKRQSFGVNKRLTITSGSSWKGIDLNNVRAQSVCILVADGFAKEETVFVTGYGAGDASYCYISDIEIPADRHTGGTNILKVDGHVRWYRKEDIPSSKLWRFSTDEQRRWWNKLE